MSYNYLYARLLKHNLQFGNKKVSRNMQAYVALILKKYSIVNIKVTMLTLNKLFNLMLHIKNNNGRILFVGHPFNKLINKIIRLTALISNQYFYHLRLESLDYALLSENLVTIKPDLIITFTSSFSLPILKIASNLEIPTFGICDTKNKPDLLTYYIVGEESSPNIIYFLCQIFLDILRK